MAKATKPTGETGSTLQPWPARVAAFIRWLVAPELLPSASSPGRAVPGSSTARDDGAAPMWRWLLSFEELPSTSSAGRDAPHSSTEREVGATSMWQWLFAIDELPSRAEPDRRVSGEGLLKWLWGSGTLPELDSAPNEPSHRNRTNP